MLFDVLGVEARQEEANNPEAVAGSAYGQGYLYVTDFTNNRRRKERAHSKNKVQHCK